MKEYNLTIEAFTTSYSIDTFANGTKQSHFVSAAFRSDPPIQPEDFAYVQLEAAMRVTSAVIQDAVSRGCMTEDEARDRISNARENFNGLRNRIAEMHTTKK